MESSNVLLLLASFILTIIILNYSNSLFKSFYLCINIFMPLSSRSLVSYLTDRQSIYLNTKS